MLVELERDFRLLRGSLGLRKVFMEIGADGCALASRVAGYVERAYAVHLRPFARPVRPGNLVPLRCEGPIPVPPGSVHVAFSRDFRPQQLPDIHRALSPGGRYICLAPGSSRAHFLKAGFRKLRLYARIGRWKVRLPLVPPFLRTLCIEAVK
jgi:hypothetical protein